MRTTLTKRVIASRPVVAVSTCKVTPLV
jgi:hypothetical protein